MQWDSKHERFSLSANSIPHVYIHGHCMLSPSRHRWIYLPLPSLSCYGKGLSYSNLTWALTQSVTLSYFCILMSMLGGGGGGFTQKPLYECIIIWHHWARTSNISWRSSGVQALPPLLLFPPLPTPPPPPSFPGNFTYVMSSCSHLTPLSFRYVPNKYDYNCNT